MDAALKLQQMLTQDSSLRPADVALLAVAERDDIRPAGPRADPAHHFDICQRPPTEADEMRRIEAGFQILEPIRERVGFIPRRRQMQQFPFSDDRCDLFYREDDDLVLMAHRSAFEGGLASG